jgi:hypothetical protein
MGQNSRKTQVEPLPPRHQKKPWDHDVRWYALVAILIVLGLLALLSVRGWH